MLAARVVMSARQEGLIYLQIYRTAKAAKDSRTGQDIEFLAIELNNEQIATCLRNKIKPELEET